MRSVGLSKKQKQRLTEKKLAASLRGAKKVREQRIAITEKIKQKARKEIGDISKRDLWLIGVALYWAEGAKQKEHAVSERVRLGNSDARIIKIFLAWLVKICGISRNEIQFRIALHETARHRLDEIKQYWAKVVKCSVSDFQKTTWKKHNIRTTRKNIGKDYYGLLEVCVRKSTNLNRKIQGWVEGIYNNCGVV